MTDVRFQVMSRRWDESNRCAIDAELLGITDSMVEGDRMVAAHAAAHGKAIDHQNYSISVLPWPDPESMARDKVASWIRLGFTYGEVIKGQGGHGSTAHSSQIGGFFYAPGAVSGTKLAAHEMVCRIGDDWRIFDLRLLWTEEVSGMRQGSLL